MFMKNNEWIKFFNVSQTELIERFSKHGIKINKSRMSLLFNNKADFTDWQKAKLKTIKLEVFKDRQKAFSLYKQNLIYQRKLSENQKKLKS